MKPTIKIVSLTLGFLTATSVGASTAALWTRANHEKQDKENLEARAIYAALTDMNVQEKNSCDIIIEQDANRPAQCAGLSHAFTVTAVCDVQKHAEETEQGFDIVTRRSQFQRHICTSPIKDSVIMAAI